MRRPTVVVLIVSLLIFVAFAAAVAPRAHARWSLRRDLTAAREYAKHLHVSPMPDNCPTCDAANRIARRAVEHPRVVAAYLASELDRDVVARVLLCVFGDDKLQVPDDAFRERWLTALERGDPLPCRAREAPFASGTYPALWRPAEAIDRCMTLTGKAWFGFIECPEVWPPAEK